MKGDRSIRQVFVKCYGRGGYVKVLEIKARTGLEALDDGFLNLVPGLEPIAATGKYYDGKEKSRRKS